MSDTVNQPRIFEVLTAEAVRSRQRPRDWSDDEKAPASGVVSPVTAGPASPARFARVETTCSASIDIVVADMIVRVGSAFDPGHLVKVLRAARKA